MAKKFVIVGCGRIGIRHAEQAAKVGKLMAVCDTDKSKADHLAAVYNVKAYYTLEQMLKGEQYIDVVSICTPNGLHTEHSIKSLDAGINVLCEKPLCLNINDARKMIAVASKRQKQLFVVKQNRYNPPIAFLRQLICENKLGRIFSFQLNCFWNRPAEYYTDWKGTKRLDGGTLFTQFSHFIDLIYWLMGDVQQVKAIMKNYNHPYIEFEDTGMVLFEMVNGIIGSLNYTVNSFEKNMEGSLTIFAEKGTIKIGGQYLNELEYCNVENVPIPDLPKCNQANAYGFYQGSMSNHDKVYENLIKALDNPEYEMASAEDGLKTVEIIEKIYSRSSL